VEAVRTKVKGFLKANPQIEEQIKKYPKLQKILPQCIENPMSCIKYLGDPEFQPVVQALLGTLRGGMGNLNEILGGLNFDL